MYIFKWKRWNKFENQLSEEGIGKKEEKGNNTYLFVSHLDMIS